MRKFLLFALLMVGMTATSKTTYIPVYRNYVHIVNAGDTLTSANILPELTMEDKGGMFRISIAHERMTDGKVKAIKRAKWAANWASISAAAATTSTAFSDNSLQYLVRSRYAEYATTLASIYAGLSVAEQILKVEAYVDNLTNEELMVADMERGRVWYVPPRQTLCIRMANPDVERLRISDTKSERVNFAIIMAGSAADKVELKHEDDDCWVSVAYRREADGTLTPLGGFRKTSKHDFSEVLMNYKDLQEFLQSTKK